MYLSEWAYRATEQVFQYVTSNYHAIPSDLREMLMTVGNVLRDIRNYKDYASITGEYAPPIIFMGAVPWWMVFKDFSDRANLGRLDGPARTFVGLINAVNALADSTRKSSLRGLRHERRGEEDGSRCDQERKSSGGR